MIPIPPNPHEPRNDRDEGKPTPKILLKGNLGRSEDQKRELGSHNVADC
jgi:hypothetical protein